MNKKSFPVQHARIERITEEPVTVKRKLEPPDIPKFSSQQLQVDQKNIETLIKTINERKRQASYTDNYKRVLDMLTPETVKRELLLALNKLENITDPRIYNCPLPNDSVPTKRFGALSYVFDGYPGYTWRLGHWFKINATLHFSQLDQEEEEMLLFTPVVKGKLFTDKVPDPTMTLDAAFYPVKIDGVRVFLREYWQEKKEPKFINNKIEYVNVNVLHETVMYLPELQSCVSCARNRYQLQQYSGAVFEDPSYISDVLNKM
jgi:hypothetical protein